MARPRKDTGGPSARERITEAFWTLYREKPFEKITVKDLCERAGCNKTTFYYHFQDTREVLEEVERQSIPTEIPVLMAEYMFDPTRKLPVAEYVEQHRGAIDRYCYLLGPNGDPEFLRKVKETMKATWCELLSIDYNKLEASDKLLVEFMLGGSTSLLAARAEGQPVDFEQLAELVRTIMLPRIQQLVGQPPYPYPS